MICEARSSADGFLIINLMQIKRPFFMAIGFAATMLLLPVTAIGQDKALGKKSHRGNLKPFAGVKISRVTAERITADTDIDRPGTPSDVFAQDNVTSVVFTWKDADKGVNGGYVDKTSLSHNIYTFENIIYIHLRTFTATSPKLSLPKPA